MSMHPSRRIWVAGAIVALLLLGSPSRAARAGNLEHSEHPVRVGVLAKRGEARCRDKWTATIDYLGQTIPSHRFELVPLDFDQVSAAVEGGMVDFILVNSSMFVDLEIAYAVSPIVTLVNLQLDHEVFQFAGTIIRRVDREEIAELDDLRGKRFLAVKPNSFGGWQMAWRELVNHGIDPHRDFASLEFAGTHDAVVLAVLEGRVDAGTVRSDTIERMAAEGKIDLDHLALVGEHHDPQLVPFRHSTVHYPEWPLAKLEHTDNTLAAEVAVALLHLDRRHPAAQAALSAGWMVPLSYEPVHECMRELRIGAYADHGKISLGDVAARYWLHLAGMAMLLTVSLAAVIITQKLNSRLGASLALQRRETDERRRAEERLDMALDGANLGSWYLTREDGAFQVHPRWPAQLGFPAEAMAATPAAWSETLLDGGRLTADALLEAERDDASQGIEQEYRCQDAEGHPRWILDSGRVIEWDERGEPLRLAGTFRDISDHKRMEFQLGQANKLESMGQLAAGIAHEINTPTQFIGDNLGFLESSSEDLIGLVDEIRGAVDDDDERYAELGKRIDGALSAADYEFLKDELPQAIRQSQEGVERVRVIVRAMKDFSHPGSDQKEPCNLNDAIDSTLTVGRSEWKYIAEMNLDLDPELPAVPCLIAEFKQVILNLVVNAAHAIAEKNGGDSGPMGRIDISTRRVGDDVEIRVGDTGGGIPEEIREKVFEPFFTTKGIGKGTGQGLAIAHESITERHGGELSFEVEPGAGTTFVIRLPLDGRGGSASTKSLETRSEPSTT